MALLHRYEFEKRSDETDGYGNREATFTKQFELDGSRIHLRGGETVQASRLEGRQPIVIRVHNCAAVRAVTTDWRIVDKRTGETYNVRSFTPMEDRIWYEFLCESGVADG